MRIEGGHYKVVWTISMKNPQSIGDQRVEKKRVTG